MERIRSYFENLAALHIGLQHREADPHFCYLNDEKEMLLPAQMGFPFVMLGHNGYEITEDELHKRWQVMLSVQTHVTDTGDEREKNCAAGLCMRILDDLLIRCKSRDEISANNWLRGIDLSKAVVSPIENEAEALYGWVVEFHIDLPWCRKVKGEVWKSAR